MLDGNIPDGLRAYNRMIDMRKSSRHYKNTLKIVFKTPLKGFRRLYRFASPDVSSNAKRNMDVSDTVAAYLESLKHLVNQLKVEKYQAIYSMLLTCARFPAGQVCSYALGAYCPCCCSQAFGIAVTFMWGSPS